MRLGAVLVAALLVTAGVGSADAGMVPAAGQASYCQSAGELVGALAELPTTDLDDGAQRRRFFRRLDRIVNTLEREAPKRLRRAYRTLRPVYDLIAEDPDEVGLLVSEPKARRALARLARHAERECGITVPAP